MNCLDGERLVIFHFTSRQPHTDTGSSGDDERQGNGEGNTEEDESLRQQTKHNPRRRW